MQSHKVMRQMPERSGRAGRRHGEAGPDTASDETRGTLHEHPDTGSAKQLQLQLDEWLRHRLRAIQLNHWKRPGAIYRELKALGAKENVARQVAVNSRRWWRNSDRLLKTVLTIAYFDGLGVPRLS